MNTKIEQNFAQNKYSIIQDLNGNAGIFFKYSGILIDVAAEMEGVRMKIQNMNNVTEKMRSAMVNSMRVGQKFLCYIFGKEKLSMMDFNDENEFPVQMLLDFEQSRIQDNYCQIVHEDEKFDNVSRKVDGTFFMSDNYGVVIVT